MFRKVLLTFGLLLMAEMAALAQGTVKGTITDKKTNEPMPFVNVVLKQDGKQVQGAQTDFDGIFSIKGLEVGNYDVEVSFVGYTRYLRTGVYVKASGFTVIDVQLTPEATNLDEVIVEVDAVPIIERGTAETGERFTSEDIVNMPGQSVDAIVAAVGGMGFNDGGAGTARGEGNMVTIQGGARKRTGINVMKDAIQEIQVILGGTPASIGEAIGGAQIITLKPPTRSLQGLVRWEGWLDYRLLNSLSVYLTGPLYKVPIRDAEGNITGDRPLVGFRFTGQGTYRNWPYYRVRDYRFQIVKDDIVRYLEENPISYDPLTGGTNYTAETMLRRNSFHEITRLTSKDFTSASRVPDLQAYSIALEGALDFRFTDYTSLVITGEFSASHSPSGGISPLTMPLVGSMVGESKNMVLTVDFTQRFKNSEPIAADGEEQASSPIKNVMYNITAFVNRATSKSYNENFGSSIDDIFKYGYIGQFITEKTPSYEYKLIDYYGSQRYAFVQNAWRDNVTYVSGSGIYNPLLANYNEQLFNSPEFEDIRDNLYQMDYIRQYKGLFNGDSPGSVYGLTNVGVQGASYAVSQDDFLYLSAKASAEVFGHDIELGFQYDQQWNSYYSVGAYSIWTLMRNSANSHLTQLDFDNPIYDPRGSQLYVDYKRKLDSEQQTYFDRAFRDYLNNNGYTNSDGSPIDEYSWIDIDRYMPEDFVNAGGLSMFSSDELINSGNPYVSYSGYDHAGEKYNGANWSLDKFFNPSDGKFRYLPAFSPIYAAGYIQDKFFFSDLIFNVGVRVDYFNGNQYVMKDPYLLYEAYKVSDLKANPDLIAGGGQYLNNAGDDWVPYVDQVSNAEGASKPIIKGYRDMDGRWYNADGVEQISYVAVNGNSGKPTPYYTEKGLNAIANRTVGTEAFERYTPQIVAMPRIAFSFPVGEKSQFKASYDIIARRPSSGWEAEYTKYLYMSQISSINNPNLKPERITNYELGFQQMLTDRSAISASAYYKETRDLIQLIQYAGADPNPNYYSYDNKDFRTTKGLTLSYDLRKSKNIRVNANYTLQYAEGTGLSAGTMTELIKEGYTTLKMLNPIADDRRHEFKANVDFRYGSGEAYNGPTIDRVVTDENGQPRSKVINVLENFGINFLAVVQSGRPYTKALSNSQTTIVGGYRGARLPWGFYLNVVVDKVWPIQVGKRKTFIKADVTFDNILDIRNVLNVFPVTGNPEDNGYLTDPEMQQAINSWLDPQAFRDIYAISLRNGTWNYSNPRTIRVAVSYNF